MRSLFSPGSRSPLIPLVARSLFRSSSLTESLEQAIGVLNRSSKLLNSLVNHKLSFDHRRSLTRRRRGWGRCLRVPSNNARRQHKMDKTGKTEREKMQPICVPALFTCRETEECGGGGSGKEATSLQLPLAKLKS